MIAGGNQDPEILAKKTMCVAALDKANEMIAKAAEIFHHLEE